MQRCPKCGRTYESDTQKFCTHDGGRLAPDTQSTAQTAHDLNQTVRTDPFDPEMTVQRMPDLNKTVASLPTSEIRSKDTGPATQPPPVAPYEPPPVPPTPAQGPTVVFDQSPPPAAPPQAMAPPQQQQQYYQPPPPVQPPQAQHPPVQPPPYAPQPPAQPQQYAPPPASPQQQYAPPPAHTPQQTLPAAQRKKSSRAPLVIGIVLVLLLGGAAAWYFLIYKKGETAANSNSSTANTNTSANTNTTANANRGAGGNTNTSANTNTNVSEPAPPPNSTKFVNSKANLDGKLAEYYSDFSFYYPNSWTKDPNAGVAGSGNFVKVERQESPEFPEERFVASYYESKGTLEADRASFPTLIQKYGEKFAPVYPNYRKVSEGETTINGYKGYEFRFESSVKGSPKGDVTYWGRVVFLPPGVEGNKNGITLLMLTSSLAPEIKSADDVGVKGELPTILNSFRMGSR